MQRRYIGPSNVGDMWARPECWEPPGTPRAGDTLTFSPAVPPDIVITLKTDLVAPKDTDEDNDAA